MSDPVPTIAPIDAELRSAVQELLRAGVVYATSKPNVHRTLRAHETAVVSILAPLDLLPRFDDVRGLVFVAVSATGATGHSEADVTTNGANGSLSGDPAGDPSVQADEAWSHPLVRRQRLTLEQSLLLAILRRRYTEHEMTVGVGAAEPTVVLDELIGELQVYLGAIGSETAEDKRVNDLLDQLQRHGVVSTVVDDQVSIRPLICHVADPGSLALLLSHYRAVAAGRGGDGADGPGGHP